MDIVTVLDSREDLVSPILINEEVIIRIKSNGDVVSEEDGKLIPMSGKILKADYLLIKELHKAHITDFLQKGYTLTVFMSKLTTYVQRISFKNGFYHIQGAHYKPNIDWSNKPIVKHNSIKDQVIYGVWSTMVEQEM